MKLKTATKAVLGLAVLLTASLAGQENKPIPEIEIVNRLDRNEDGFLAAEEIPSSMRVFIKSLVKTRKAEGSVDKKTGKIDLQILEKLVRENQEKTT